MSILPPAVAKSIAECPAFRIKESDTNYFVLIFDTEGEGCPPVAILEIFEKGGATPPNQHSHAYEMFFILQGEGLAYADDHKVELSRGSALLINPGSNHVVENTGEGKLYSLTIMTPDEGFAKLIRSGTPVELDDEDKAVIHGMALQSL